MARKSTRAAQGGGTIRQRPDGRWEARFTVGRDPGTGKQIQRSVYGSTQKEVRQKLAQAVAEVDNGTYQAPSKMTVGQWLDIWQKDYLGGVKPFTAQGYEKNVRVYIKPALGAIKLDALNAHTVQKFINDMGKPHEDKPPLSPKTVRNAHGVLHKALQQAVKVGYIRFNPADACELPRLERKEINPLDSDAMAAFMRAIGGHRFEAIYLTMLFTGMRRGEAFGLLWDCVDLDKGTIRIDRQLQNIPGRPGEFRLISTKNGKGRTITAAPFVVELLKKHRARQLRDRLKSGPLWQDHGYVFCNEVGEHLSPSTVYHNYKEIVASIGLPDLRLHDLRHSYAVASLRAGDDVKTVQSNMGHHTAAFTLDVYGHVTEEMKRASADRMEAYIKGIANL
ncbi:MAG: site-specific integrase [Oscillospiraceae bacterium]|mgnify:CR=1 FL=1|nr:site-specific integrase [Oscillospiraceae bacterium]MCI9165855.1 site-specific integrase [Oscillospiraceae bacterium]